MKTTRRNSIHRLALAITLSAGLGFVSPASARSYIVDLNSKTVTDLGTLGSNYIYAKGINAGGQVVGDSTETAGVGSTEAFITGPNGMGMTRTRLDPLAGGSYAFGINAAGQVVGDSTGHPFVGVAVVSKPSSPAPMAWA